MSTTLPASEPARTTTTLRERLLDAAVAMTCDSGWSSVTMARLADGVGVSRQTVYNEVGSKSQLAEAMVMRELERFLAVVDRELRSQDDMVEAIRAAARGIFTMAEDNPLLHAVVSASHGAEVDLLPLLTTHSEALLETATSMVREQLTRFEVPLDPARLDVGIDAVVRLVLSHVMQPGKPPEASADDIAWIVGRVLWGDPR
jgi:AcrR family transcriptional regulator